MKKADLIVSAGSRSSDLRYLTRLSTPDDFIYFADDETSAVLMSALEFDLAKKLVPDNVEVWDASIYGTSHAEAIYSLAQKRQIDTFDVPRDFPLSLADQLRNLGLTVLPRRSAFVPKREFKSTTEIEQITIALRLAEKALRQAFEVIGASSINSRNELVYHGEILTSEVLRSEIELVLFKGGASPKNPIVAGGIQGAYPHELGHGTLYANTPIVLDVFPRLNSCGYWGDITRTVVKGSAPEIVQKAFNAVREARDMVKPLIKRGAIPRDIHQAAAAHLHNSGFDTGKNANGNYGFFHGLGHGVGLDIHEAPRLSLGGSEPLKGGEVITDEPGLYYPEWGGIRLEDMMVVTPEGSQCLTELETFLEIE